MVSEGNKIKIHYTLQVDGEIKDTSEGRKPLEFQVGSNQVIPGFEKGIIGMTEGEKRSFQVNPLDGYGEEDLDAIQEIPRDKLPKGLEPEVGMTLYTPGKEGEPIPLWVQEIKPETVVVNMNHPLAGKTLNFEVEVLEITK